MQSIFTYNLFKYATTRPSSLAPAMVACDALPGPAERLVAARAPLHVEVHLVLVEAPYPGARFNRLSFCFAL